MLLRLSLLLLLVFSFTACEQKENSSIPESKSIKHVDQSFNINTDSLTQVAIDHYHSNPRNAISAFKQSGTQYIKDKKYDKAATNYLNLASLYDENLDRPDSALIYAEKSMFLWENQKDSMQIANLYKYVGYLKGRNGNPTNGIVDIEKALDIYKKLDYAPGVAVSQFNLAQNYYELEDYEKADNFYNKATQFWIEQNNNSRIFVNNIFAIKLYDKMGKIDDRDALISQNNLIRNQETIDKSNLETYQTLLHEH